MTKVIASKAVDQFIVRPAGSLWNNPLVVQGKGKGAPPKADYQNAIINADPLCKIGSLVHRAIRRHMQVDELIVLTEIAGLSKEIRRSTFLSDYWLILELIFGEESKEKR